MRAFPCEQLTDIKAFVGSARGNISVFEWSLCWHKHRRLFADQMASLLRTKATGIAKVMLRTITGKQSRGDAIPAVVDWPTLIFVSDLSEGR